MENHRIADSIEIYLLENKISLYQVAKELGISEDKILGRKGECMLASEFLELCQYLNVEPETFKF